MDILCISDIHGEKAALDLLAGEIAHADLILVAGDFTDFGGGLEMEDMLRPFEARKDRMAAVPGNCDRQAARRALEASGISVDGRAIQFSSSEARLAVIGAGGGLVHTGLTPYERKDVELAECFEKALHLLDYRKADHPLLVALSHTPPFGTEADLRHGSHTGSKGLRNMLDAMRPSLWVCGHIHEGRSLSRSERTMVVNPGPLREGYYAKVKADFSQGEGSFEAELLRL